MEDIEFDLQRAIEAAYRRMRYIYAMLYRHANAHHGRYRLWLDRCVADLVHQHFTPSGALSASEWIARTWTGDPTDAAAHLAAEEERLRLHLDEICRRERPCLEYERITRALGWPPARPNLLAAIEWQKAFDAAPLSQQIAMRRELRARTHHSTSLTVQPVEGRVV